MSNDEPQSLRDVAIRIKDLHRPGSGRQLDAKAKKDGLKITYTTINSMAAGTYDSIPSVATVEALIALADYPREVVYLVAGVPMPLKPLADDLPPDADSLEPKQRKVVVDAIRQFAHQNRENAVLRSELRKAGIDSGTSAQKTHESGVVEYDAVGLDDDPTPLHEAENAEES